MQIGSSIEEVDRRSIVNVLKSSLSDKPTKDHLTDEANKVRYKLLIDSSEDESVRRLLFSFKIVDPSTTKTYMCSDFPEDSEVQKVQMCTVTKCVLHVDMMHELYYYI